MSLFDPEASGGAILLLGIGWQPVAFEVVFVLIAITAVKYQEVVIFLQLLLAIGEKTPILFADISKYKYHATRFDMTLKDVPQIKKPSRALVEKIEKLETKNKGMVAAIDPDSGEYFLGAKTLSAVEKGRKKYPNAVFYCIRIGYPGVYQHRGGLTKV